MYFSPGTCQFYSSPDAVGDCVEVPDELHNSVLAVVAQGGTIEANQEGMPVGVPRPLPAALTLEEMFHLRLNDCNTQYSNAVTALRGTYPFAETTTWPVQIKEALDYDAWRTAGSQGTPPSTPFLTDLTAQRDARGVGSGLVDLVDRVLANNLIYSPGVARITSIRHAAEQALYVAAYMTQTAEAIQAVTWDFAPEQPD
ncbi:hypothetical protein D9M68_18660 [compost metagenome]